MTYPTRPWWTPVKLELAFGADPASDPAAWQWTDVSADLDRAQQLTISRGRPDESGQTRPTSVSARLVNNHSHYTPGHPASPHYPHVRQGVPARVSVQAGGPHLRVPGVGSGARLASSSALNVADLDVRVEWAPDRVPAAWGATAPEGWRPYAHAYQEIIGRYAANAAARMWVLMIDASGVPRLGWSTTGDNHVEQAAREALPTISGQRIALRATLEVNDGNGGHTVAFHVAPTLAGPWRPLGGPITRAGATSIYQAGSAPLDIGDVATLAYVPSAGRYYRAELRGSIDGPVLAAPDFTAASPGDSGLTDPQGNVWQFTGRSEITDWRVRMVGQVADWSPTWPYGDLSDPARPIVRPGEARCDITIAGPLRRLGQGAKALQSTLRRRIPSYDPVAYWPMEEERGATQAYSPIEGVAPLAVGGLQFGAGGGPAGSSPLPTLTDAASIRGSVPAAPAGRWRIELVYRLEQMPTESGQLLDIRTTSRPWNRFEVRVTPATVQVIGYDTTSDSSSSTLLINSNPVRFLGAWARLSLSETALDGGMVRVTLNWEPIGDSPLFIWETYAGTTGRVTQVLAQPGPALQGMPVGHLAAFATASSEAFQGADDGYTGETALARMRRLAEEEQLPISVLGVASASPAMGPQRPATLLTLLQECADVDGGVLAERRETPGLMYRPRQVLYNQAPGVSLGARANEIDSPFSPVLDDQRLRNDITVSRAGGSSARAVDDQSVAAVGLYDEAVTVNVAEDRQLDDIAAWRLHEGTWPGMRYPAVASALDIAPQLIDSWLDRLEGDRLQVADLPPQHPSDVVDLMAEGLTETLTPTRWSIEAAASPGGPWIVGEVGEDDPAEEDAPTHVDTDGSTLAADVDATSGQLIVQTLVGPAWVTTAGPTPTAADGDLPVDLAVGGEVVTAVDIEPFVWDDFGRSVTDGWGDLPCTMPVSWVLSGGSPADRSVAGGRGVVALSSPGVSRFQFVSGWVHADAEVLVSVTPSAVAAGAPVLAGVCLRISGSEWYWPRLVLGLAGTVGLEIARGVTPISALVSTGRTYAGGSTWWLRARTVGTSIQARAWPAGTVEPTAWQVTADDSGITSGYAGVVALAPAGNTNSGLTMTFSGFELVSPQLMTVTRSVNGVAKSHQGGGAIRLHQPMIVGL